MLTILKTDRFSLIPWQNSAEHNLHFVDLFKDPQVQKYVNGKPYTDEDIKKIIPIMASQTEKYRGFGTWMIYDTQTCVGIIFLKSILQADDAYIYELGYWLKPSFWGLGIAQETIKSAVKFGFEQLNLPEIIAIVERKNLPSQNALLKTGFIANGDVVEEGRKLPAFVIKNQQHKMADNPILKTQRFSLYPWVDCPEFNRHITEMMQSEQVQKYVFEHALNDEEVSQAFERMKTNQKPLGLGYWMVYKGDICVGMTLLKALPTEDDLNYIETGYWLKPKFWGQGIAAEVAAAMVKHAFEQLNLPHIVGVTNPENIASQKSLEKAGLKRQGNITAYESQLSFFKIENPNQL
ncbi:MAG: GNAT family N-acetyltransferase [Rhizobiales bacterium]|nr:GNAT family N-acetyltransferase [Hyphomicrobiales bacterium]NRB14692.1 GNAT family N-acetyltransferase [Hyphomicrobiales bacterium]